ncbi:MAG TPA: hypothetical protein PKE65_00990, partial [Rhizobiaceae bacterium]|nr:hypothetical protein [Rhizobiaceae bacterium]
GAGVPVDKRIAPDDAVCDLGTVGCETQSGLGRCCRRSCVPDVFDRPWNGRPESFLLDKMFYFRSFSGRRDPWRRVENSTEP